MPNTPPKQISTPPKSRKTRYTSPEPPQRQPRQKPPADLYNHGNRYGVQQNERNQERPNQNLRQFQVVQEDIYSRMEYAIVSQNNNLNRPNQPNPPNRQNTTQPQRSQPDTQRIKSGDGKYGYDKYSYNGENRSKERIEQNEQPNYNAHRVLFQQNGRARINVPNVQKQSKEKLERWRQGQQNVSKSRNTSTYESAPCQRQKNKERITPYFVQLQEEQNFTFLPIKRPPQPLSRLEQSLKQKQQQKKDDQLIAISKKQNIPLQKLQSGQVILPKKNGLYSPERKLEKNSKQSLTYEQMQLTEEKKEPWQTTVPKEEYGEEQNKDENLLPKPLEEYEIDESQRRITDYVGQNSLSQRNKKKPSKDKESEEGYKVVVKTPSPQKPRCQQQSSFYKNNDIYGVQDEIQRQMSQMSPSHVQNHQNVFNQLEIEYDMPLQPISQDKQIEIEGQFIPVKSQQVDIEMVPPSSSSKSKQSSKPQIEQILYTNNETLNSNVQNYPTSTRTEEPPTKPVEGNLVTQDIKQTQSQQNSVHGDGSVEVEGRMYQTEEKSKKGKDSVDFYYNKQGDVIYTQKCYKQPLSGKNMKAYVKPIEEENASEMPQSANKTIYYRKEEELNQILDHFDMKEVKVEAKQSEEEKPKKEEQSDNEQKQEYVKEEPFLVQKPIKIERISDLRPHYVGQEQVDVFQVHPLVDRPHPAVPVKQQKPDSKRQTKQIKTEAKRTTKKKEFLKGTTARYSTPSRQQLLSENPSNLQEVQNRREDNPPGSVYHFKLIPEKKSHRKSLVQVRRSSRIFSKSKQNLKQESSQLQKIQETEIDNQNTNTAARNSLTKQPKNHLSKSKSKSKPRVLTTTTTKSKSKRQPHNQEQEPQEIVTIEWLKEHFPELDQIVVENVYMYDEYRAMTQQDEAISRFLQELEDKKSLKREDYGELDAASRGELQVEPIRENEMMRPIVKSKGRPVTKKEDGKGAKSSKKTNKTSRKTKSKPKLSQSKPQKFSNIKIQRTVEVNLTKSKNQNRHQNNQQEENPQYEQVEVDGSFNPKEQEIFNNNEPKTESQLKADFKATAAKYRVPQEFPLTVDRVIDPDILNLGVYALIKLGRLSEFHLGTKYAITPICVIRFAKKRDILRSLEESKKLVPKEYEENIAFVALNSVLVGLIGKAKNEREREKQEEERRKQKEDEERRMQKEQKERNQENRRKQQLEIQRDDRNQEQTDDDCDKEFQI